MNKPIFKGAGVALITPMYSDGSVNYDELARLLEFQVENGTDAIIACGTTGEAATLSVKEHCEVLSFVCERINGRIPVIAGTGSNDTSTAIELSKSAESSGADALLSVTPYYNKTSQTGLIRHFTTAVINPAHVMIRVTLPTYGQSFPLCYTVKCFRLLFQIKHVCAPG